MVQYRMVPFVAQIAKGEGSDVVAKQLADLVNEYGSQGWEFVQLEDVVTLIHDPGRSGAPGSAGCFGIGSTPYDPGILPSTREAVYYIAVFKQG